MLVLEKTSNWLLVLLNTPLWNLGAKSGHLMDIVESQCPIGTPISLNNGNTPFTWRPNSLLHPLLLNLIFCIFIPFEFHCISLLPQSKFLLSTLSLAQHTYYLFDADTSVPIFFLRLLLVVQLRGLYYSRHSCCHIGDRSEFWVSVFERNILEVYEGTIL